MAERQSGDAGATGRDSLLTGPGKGPHSIWEALGSITGKKQGQPPGNVFYWAKARRGLGRTRLDNCDHSRLQRALCLPFLALRQFRAGEMLARSRDLNKELLGDLDLPGLQNLGSGIHPF